LKALNSGKHAQLPHYTQTGKMAPRKSNPNNLSNERLSLRVILYSQPERNLKIAAIPFQAIRRMRPARKESGQDLFRFATPQIETNSQNPPTIWNTFNNLIGTSSHASEADTGPLKSGSQGEILQFFTILLLILEVSQQVFAGMGHFCGTLIENCLCWR
jgi:hypothetical protein